MKLGLAIHPRKKKARELGGELLAYGEELIRGGADLEFVLSDDTASKLERTDLSTSKIGKMKVEAIICLGGDGTLLRVLKTAKRPVLGINVGSLGFLMEVQPANFKDAVDRLLDKRYSIEKRSRIRTLLNGEKLPDATNEAVLITSTPSKIQSYEMIVDMFMWEKLRADGLIICTPTGSTGYAMSAGGSILDPKLEAFEIVPIAPFMNNMKPLIVPDTYLISMKVSGKSNSANLVIDGSTRKIVNPGDDLLFTRSKEDARLVKFDTSFYTKYQEKIINSNIK